MTLLAVVVAYLVLRWWGAATPLHRDGWFFRWTGWLSEREGLRPLVLTRLSLALLLPPTVLLLLLIAASELWYGLQLLIVVPVLLYAVGRGRYRSFVKRYTRARREDDWAEALESYRALTIPGHHWREAEQGNWPALDRDMLAVVSYRGLERVFAVLFWFVILGAAGALIYRLAHLHLRGAEGEERRLTEALVWLLEWPTARVLGLSFALTGNFVGCMQEWREVVWSRISAPQVITGCVRGALFLEEERSAPAETVAKGLNATVALHSRTLIFWLSLLALGTILL